MKGGPGMRCRRCFARITLVGILLCWQLGHGRSQGSEGVRIVSDHLGKTPNLARIGQRIFFAGQPGADDFGLFARRGVRTVINLRTDQEVEALSFDEGEVVRREGMAYMHVPVAAGGLSRDGLGEIAQKLTESDRHPVLIHCASSNRVGYVWALFRMLRDDLAVDEAVNEGKAAGLRSPALEQKVRAAKRDEVLDNRSHRLHP